MSVSASDGTLTPPSPLPMRGAAMSVLRLTVVSRVVVIEFHGKLVEDRKDAEAIDLNGPGRMRAHYKKRNESKQLKQKTKATISFCKGNASAGWSQGRDGCACDIWTKANSREVLGDRLCGEVDGAKLGNPV